jgi:hypothetical protein
LAGGSNPTSEASGNPTISAIKKGSPSGESFLIFGVDKNPPGEYLTPQNSKPKAGLS